MKKYVGVTDLVHMGYGSRATIMRQIYRGNFTKINPGGGKWIIDLNSYEEWLKEEEEYARRKRIYR